MTSIESSGRLGSNAGVAGRRARSDSGHERAVAVAVTGRVRRQRREVDLAEHPAAEVGPSRVDTRVDDRDRRRGRRALARPVDRSVRRPRPQLLVRERSDAPVITTVSFDTIEATPPSSRSAAGSGLPLSFASTPLIAVNCLLDTLLQNRVRRSGPPSRSAAYFDEPVRLRLPFVVALDDHVERLPAGSAGSPLSRLVRNVRLQIAGAYPCRYRACPETGRRPLPPWRMPLRAQQ